MLMITNHPIIATTISGIRRHPWWTSVFSVGGIAFIWDRFSDFQTGAGLMTAWLGKNWFSIMVHSPWFTVAGLILAIGSLWRIGSLSAHEEAKGAERAIAALKLETEHRNSALEKPLNIIHLFVRQQAILQAFEHLAQLQTGLQSYKKNIERFNSSFTDPFLTVNHDAKLLKSSIMRFNWAMLDIDPIMPELRLIDPVLIPGTGYKERTRFEPEHNAKFIDAVNADLFELTRAIKHIQESIEKEQKTVNEKLKEVCNL